MNDLKKKGFDLKALFCGVVIVVLGLVGGNVGLVAVGLDELEGVSDQSIVEVIGGMRNGKP